MTAKKLATLDETGKVPPQQLTPLLTIGLLAAGLQSGPTDTVPLPAAADGVGTKTLSTAPMVCGAGDFAAGLSLEGTTADCRLSYIEMFVTNADGSESLIVYAAGPAVLAEGASRILAQAEWGTPSITGSDLSLVNGSVQTAAGGTYWAQIQVEASLPPA